MPTADVKPPAKIPLAQSRALDLVKRRRNNSKLMNNRVNIAIISSKVRLLTYSKIASPIGAPIMLLGINLKSRALSISRRTSRNITAHKKTDKIRFNSTATSELCINNNKGKARIENPNPVAACSAEDKKIMNAV